MTVDRHYGQETTQLNAPQTTLVGRSENLEDVARFLKEAHATVEAFEHQPTLTENIHPSESDMSISSTEIPNESPPHSRCAIHVVFQVFRVPVNLTATIYPSCGGLWWNDALAPTRGSQDCPFFSSGDSTGVVVLDHRVGKDDQNAVTLKKAPLINPNVRNTLVVSVDYKKYIERLRNAHLAGAKYFDIPRSANRLARSAADFSSTVINPAKEGKLYCQQLRRLWRPLRTVYDSQTSLILTRLYECQSIVRRRLQYSAAILARLHNPILNLVQSPLDPADQERLDSRCSTIWEDQIFDRDFEEAQAAFHTAAASAPWFCPITREASTYLKLNLPTASVSAQGLGLDLPSLPDNEDVLYANELLQHPDPFPKAVEGATRRLDAAITGHLAYLHVRLQSAFTQCFDGMFAPTVLHLIHRRILEPLIDQGLSQTKEALKNRARELWLSIRSAPERNVPEFCARVDFILESFRITRNAYLATLGECAQHERERPLFPEQLPESRESRSAPSDIGETQSILVDNLKALNLGSSANLVRSQLQEGDFDPAYWVAALVEAGSPSVAQELLSSYPAIVQRNLIAHVREGARAALSGPLCNISVEEKAAVEEVLQRYERICNSVRGYTEVEGGVESEEEDGGGEIQ